MTEAIGTMRELSVEETRLVSGGFSWEELFAAMAAGALSGAMAAAWTGAGIPAGALAGALIAGAGYTLNDLITICF